MSVSNHELMVSVVVPVYNGEAFLTQINNCLLGQTYHRLQIINIDDGSKDFSAALLDYYSSADNRTIIIHQNNAGENRSRNVGIRNAEGDYISIIDQDDLLDWRMYELMIAASRECSFGCSPDLICCNREIIGEKGEYVLPLNQPSNTLLDRQYLLDNVIPYVIGIKDDDTKRTREHWTYLTRTKILKENGIEYREDMPRDADTDYCIDVLALIDNIVFVNLPLYKWVRRGDSLSSAYVSEFKHMVMHVENDKRHFSEYYDFDSQQYLHHAIEDLFKECIVYIIGHHKSCNIDHELHEMICSDTAKEWFEKIEPYDSFTRKMKRLLEENRLDSAVRLAKQYYIKRRARNAARKLKKVVNTSKKFPLISVVVPVYDVADYLNQSMESVVGQTYDNLEIILVDDGSSETSGAMCDKWAARDERVRAVHKRNGGLSSARNAALDIMHGKLFICVDSDDWLEPNAVQVLFDALQKEEADIASGLWVEHSEDNGQAYRVTREGFTDNSEGTLRRLYDGAYFPVSAWGKLIKVSIWADLRFPEGKLYEDAFTTCIAVDWANRITMVSDCLYHYRVRNDSIMTSRFNMKHMDLYDAWKFNYEYCKKRYPPVAPAARELWFEWNIKLLAEFPDEMTEEEKDAKRFLKKEIAKNLPFAFQKMGLKKAYYQMKALVH